MVRNETVGKVEEFSVDGVLRQHSDGRQQSSVATVREGPSSNARGRRRGNKGKDTSRKDRTMASLDNDPAATQKHRATGSSYSELLSRRQLHVLFRKVGSATKEWLVMLVTGVLWDRFFHSRTGEDGCKMAAIIRIIYSITALLNVILMGLDFQYFFLPSTTWIPLEDGRKTIDQDTWSIFEYLPQTDAVYWTAYWLLVGHVVLLGLGVAPRWQAAGVFFWTCMFRHHDNVIWDDEDIVFKQIPLLMLFFPLDRFTIWTLLDPKRTPSDRGSWPMWPFRLLQIQMCLIYLSTGFLKWKGDEWLDGSALFYVVHLDDLYGNLFNPNWMFGYYSMLQFLTWQTLVFEVVFPILLWFDSTRSFALFVTFGFHLGLDLSMNLNFFHWIMSIGWMSFYIQPVMDGGVEQEKKPMSKKLS